MLIQVRKYIYARKQMSAILVVDPFWFGRSLSLFISLLQTRFKLRRFISLTLRLVTKRRLNLRLTPNHAAQTSTLLRLTANTLTEQQRIRFIRRLRTYRQRYGVVSRSFCNKSWRIERLFRDISCLPHGCLPLYPYRSRVLYLLSSSCLLFC